MSNKSKKEFKSFRDLANRGRQNLPADPNQKAVKRKAEKAEKPKK